MIKDPYINYIQINLEFIITAKRSIITDTTAGCSRDLFRHRSQGNYFLTFPLKSLILSKSYITFVAFYVVMYYIISINLNSGSVEILLTIYIFSENGGKIKDSGKKNKEINIRKTEKLH